MHHGICIRHCSDYPAYQLHEYRCSKIESQKPQHAGTHESQHVQLTARTILLEHNIQNGVGVLSKRQVGVVVLALLHYNRTLPPRMPVVHNYSPRDSYMLFIFAACADLCKQVCTALPA